MTSPTLSPHAAHHRHSWAWPIAFLVSAAIAISYLDRQTLPWAIKAIQADIPFSNQVKAGLDSAFLVTYGLMYVGGGLLLDRLGTRRGFLCIMIFWSLACASHGLAGGIIALAASRLLLGVGEGGGFPAATRVVAEWFPVADRATAMGIINGGTAIGAVMAPPLIAAILTRAHWFGLAPWRWVFFVAGAFGLIWTIFWWRLYFTPAQPLADVSNTGADEPPITLAQLLRHRETWAVVIAKFLSDGAWYFYLFWLPKYLFDVFELDIKTAGGIGWMPYAASGVGCIVGGGFSSWLLRRGVSVNGARKFALGASAALMPWVMLVPQMHSVGWVIFLFSLAFFGQQSWSTLVMILPTDMIPRRALGALAGLVGFGGALGGVTLGQIVGWLRDNGYSYTPALVISGSLHVAAFILICVVVPKIQPLNLSMSALSRKKSLPTVLFLCAAFLAFSSGAVKADASISIGGLPAEITISEVTAKTIRVEIAALDQQGVPQPAPPSPSLVDFPTKEIFSARQLAGEKKIRAGKFRVTLQARPLVLSIRRADGSLVQEIAFSESAGTNLFSFRTDAPVFGLGEGGDQFDRRGNNFPLINGQRYKLAELGARCFSPFLIGTEGWAMFVSSPAGGFDLRDGRGTFVPRSGTVAEIFITDAREPADAMSEFIHLTGAPVMPPKWALGFMQSHRTLSTEDDILAEAKRFRDGRLPCDTFIFLGTGFCPAGWNYGHDSFQLNTNVFTHDVSTVIQELHSNHLHVALHVVPLQRDYPSLRGQVPPAPGEETNQQHIANYWKRHHDLVAAGVDGWWPDEGDWLDQASRLERHRMYYEGPLSDTPNVRPWNLQRNGAPGMARYGGWIWSGDINSGWRTLAAQVMVGQNSSLSLSPFWGTDIGGFVTGTNMNYTGELFARWFQFAAFTPSFRSHGRNWKLHLPWGWNTGEIGPVEARPTPDPSELHNVEVEPVCKKYLELRYQLMPYTYTITREAHDTGRPLMRALWLHYPRDAEAVKTGGEFLWGRDLLLAPVTEKAAITRDVYLPAGNWFDWWSDEKISGGKRVQRPVDLATMPIYVRSGAIIPLDPVRQYLAQPVNEPTVLKIFPGADGDFTLYDDDGGTLAYLRDADVKTVWIHFHWNEAAQQLTIEPDKRMKRWPGPPKPFNVRKAGGSGGPVPVNFDGKRIILKL